MRELNSAEMQTTSGGVAPILGAAAVAASIISGAISMYNLGRALGELAIETHAR